MPAVKRVRFNPSALEAATIAQQPPVQQEDAAVVVPGDGQGGVTGLQGEPVKKASRSARRKALKRRLRRMGVLPYTPGVLGFEPP